MTMIEKGVYRLSASAHGGDVTVELSAGMGGHGIVLSPEEARDFVDGLERVVGEARTQRHEAETTID